MPTTENLAVYLTGKTLPDADIIQAVTAFAKMTGMDSNAALACLTGGKPRLVKRGLTQAQAQALTRRFADLGIAAVVRTSSEPTTQPAPFPAPTPTPQPVRQPPRPTPALNLAKPAQPARPTPTPTAGPPKQQRCYAPPPGMIFCTNCGNPTAVQAVGCPRCGLPTRLEKKFCYNCGTGIDPRQLMCVKCGVGLAAAGKAPSGGTSGGASDGNRMSFFQAVGTCFKKYAKGSGRASRAEFWYFFLFTVLFVFLLGLAAGYVMDEVFDVVDPDAIALAPWLPWLPVCLPYLAVTMRRLQDTGRSGWLFLVPVVPLIWCMFKGDEGPNRYGPPPGEEGEAADFVKVEEERRGLSVIHIIGIVVGVIVGVLVLGGILTDIAIPQFKAYNMRKHNTSAESDIHNAKTAQDVLIGDHHMYGVPCTGASLGDIDECGVLAGPMNAATPTSAGAMVCGVSQECIGFAIGDGVSLMGIMDGNSSSYLLFSKHKEGNRVYATEGDTTAIYVCENEAWVGLDLPAVVRQWGQQNIDFQTSPGEDNLEGKLCGGDPVAVWQPL